MAGRVLVFGVVVLMVVASVYGQSKKLKFCVSEDQARPRECANLAGSQSMVNCVEVVDSTDCALKLQKGEADFGIFTAEEAMVATYFIDQTVQVTHELRHESYRQEPFAFQTVALVRANHTGGLAGLKNKNYCHPGFKDSQSWTDRVLKYFEDKVVEKVCNRGNTAVRDELIALDKFFNQTCRPGTWVHNDYANDRLKLDYRSLCALCDNTGVACSYNAVRQKGAQESTINCLTRGNSNGRGDVAYVALQSVKEYFFGLSGSFKPTGVEERDYRFLCQNGSLQELSTPSPCAWISQPWNSIVAHKDIAMSLQTDLPRYLDRPVRGSWQDTLSSIILQGDLRLTDVSELRSISTFIAQGRELPQTNTATCRRAPRWCVTGEEKTKCDWMRTAALTIGVVPQLECVSAPDQWECFRMINESRADFTAIESNVGYISRHTYDLTTIMFQDTKVEGDNHVVGIVKKNLGISSLWNLRNRKACFPEYGGIAWVSLVEVLRKERVLPDACPYGDTLGRFFSSTCAPGAMDPTHDPTGLNRAANLCSLCRASCNATSVNPFFGDVGALQCLGTGGGEVAFINAKRVRAVLGDLRTSGDKNKKLAEDLSNNYEIMCKNGQTQSLLLDIDDNCPLIKTIGGEIVGKRTRTNVTSVDIMLALLEMDDWFGLFSHNSESVFHMYEPFDGKGNLIFTNTTLGIRTVYDVQKEEIANYIELKKRADECGAAGASAIFVGHLTWVVAILAALVVSRQ